MVGLMKPAAGLPYRAACWLTSAMYPAQSGAAALVPYAPPVAPLFQTV
jgi:hypothetical protein